IFGIERNCEPCRFRSSSHRPCGHRWAELANQSDTLRRSRIWLELHVDLLGNAVEVRLPVRVEPGSTRTAAEWNNCPADVPNIKFGIASRPIRSFAAAQRDPVDHRRFVCNFGGRPSVVPWPVPTSGLWNVP